MSKNALMVLSLMILFLIGISFAGLSIPSWTLSQDTFKPDTNGVITVEITNPAVSGDEKTVQSVTMDITTSPELLMSGQQFIGDIEPGGSTKISLPFKVAETAKSSIYSIEIKLTGIADRSEGGFDTFSRRLTIPVTVVNAPVLGLATDKQLIGGIDTLLLIVSNNGGSANNVRIRIPETSTVALYGADEIYLQTVFGEVKNNMTLDSRGASDGPIDVPFILEYEDELGIKHNDSTKLRMTVRKEKLDLTFLQKSDIVTRKESTLTLEVRNDGTEPLRDVRLIFQNNTVRLKEQNELKFGDLVPGATATVSPVVFADLPPGVNLVDSKLTWIEKDVQNEESSKIPITITSDADVGVFLEAKPLPLTIGSEHTISVLVSNLGSYAIENVDVSISSPVLKSLDISDKQYVGGLQNDDFSTVQFLMGVNATSPGTYPIDIAISYRDQSGEWKQKVIQRTLTIYEPAAEGGSSLPLIAGAVVVMLGVWYFKFRKK